MCLDCGVAEIAEIWYAKGAGLASWRQGEVSVVENLIGFLVSVIAGVVANYISKRLDRGGRNR